MMQELSVKTYVICSLLVYFVAGAHYYIFDRSVISRLFRWWDRWTSNPETNPKPDRGLVFGRTTGTQAMWAAFITITTSIWLWLHGSNPMVEVWTSIFDTTMVLAGFMVGPWAYRLWLGRNKVIEVADHIQQQAQAGKLGEEIVDVVEDLSDGVRKQASNISAKAGAAVRGVADQVADKVVGKRPFGTPDPVHQSTSDSSSAPKPPTITEEELQKRREQDRKGLEDYLNG